MPWATEEHIVISDGYILVGIDCSTHYRCAVWNFQWPDELPFKRYSVSMGYLHVPDNCLYVPDNTQDKTHRPCWTILEASFLGNGKGPNAARARNECVLWTYRVNISTVGVKAALFVVPLATHCCLWKWS